MCVGAAFQSELVKQVEQRLQELCVTRRVRVEEFFADFDKLKSQVRFMQRCWVG